MQNYNSDKEKSEIDSDLERIPVEEIAFYNKVKLSVSIDSPLCVFWLPSAIFCHL